MSLWIKLDPKVVLFTDFGRIQSLIVCRKLIKLRWMSPMVLTILFLLTSFDTEARLEGGFLYAGRSEPCLNVLLLPSKFFWRRMKETSRSYDIAGLGDDSEAGGDDGLSVLRVSRFQIRSCWYPGPAGWDDIVTDHLARRPGLPKEIWARCMMRAITDKRTMCRSSAWIFQSESENHTFV
jgi:hypothetical protein